MGKADETSTTKSRVSSSIDGGDLSRRSEATARSALVPRGVFSMRSTTMARIAIQPAFWGLSEEAVLYVQDTSVFSLRTSSSLKEFADSSVLPEDRVTTFSACPLR